ncbi:tRNA dimethylallyltransferase [Clostridia bacterium]|nr:tRNA dimethylallyltransferase [Clostridia bacterium]
MNRLIIIGGPTASGKTSLSIEMAKEVDGEIICGDSMQIYQHMQIGTAAPTIEEQDDVPHHLFSLISPLINFSVAEYVKLSNFTISDIIKRGKTPILVGGTGLYLDSIANNIDFSSESSNDNIFSELNTKTNEELFESLKTIDPPMANVIKLGDRRRLIRALEIFHTTGKTKTEYDKQAKNNRIYDVEYYAIDFPREKLYERINKRVDLMIRAGLVSEVKNLIKIGVTSSMTASQGIGYKELIPYLNGEITLDKTISAIKQASRRYAKRQLTWFRRNEEITWLKGEEK